MVTLTIDNKIYEGIRKKAAAQGLSVEGWLEVQGLAEEDQSPDSEQASTWHERLMAFAQRHRPTGTSLDTSREKIYD